jgi:dihydroxy-acid dehydratase
MKTLLDAGLLHGKCMTVTGRTVGENLADVAPYPADQKIIRPLSNLIKLTATSWCSTATSRPTALSQNHRQRRPQFSGIARTFHGEEAAMAAIMGAISRRVTSSSSATRVHKVGPACASLSPTSAINGRGLAGDVAMITDGRFRAAHTAS